MTLSFSLYHLSLSLLLFHCLVKGKQSNDMSMGDCVSSPFLNGYSSIQNAEFQLRMNSPNSYAKLDSYDQAQELEKNFCKDFTCCGLRLINLHMLLEHYEEIHSSQNNPADEEERKNPMIHFDKNSIWPFETYRPTTKEHLTSLDLNMLENAQKYASLQKIQTLNNMFDEPDMLNMSSNELVDAYPTKPLDSPQSFVSAASVFPECNDKKDSGGGGGSSRNSISSAGNNTKSSATTEDELADRPYRCHVTDCDKAYKNANGLKYHRLHGHCTFGENGDLLDENKPYVCSLEHCRKRYKNMNGLKYHMRHTHSAQPEIKQETTNPHSLKRKLSASPDILN
ncbi:hypothetical protein BD560DRAFT_474968 [Blakeslea trispora]|nr:hypothetical protein BD560DRAFT_474968 [Blakeslea trispora]